MFDSVQCDRKTANECRFQVTGGRTTLVAYIPVYDAKGNNLNPDMNTTTWSISCSVCGRSWIAKSRGGVTTTEEKL